MKVEFRKWVLNVIFLAVCATGFVIQAIEEGNDVFDVSGLQYRVLSGGKIISSGHFNNRGLANVPTTKAGTVTVTVGGVDYEWTAVEAVLAENSDSQAVAVAVQRREFRSVAQSQSLLGPVWNYAKGRPVLATVSVVVVLVAVLPAVLLRLDPDFAERVAENAMREKKEKDGKKE